MTLKSYLTSDDVFSIALFLGAIFTRSLTAGYVNIGPDVLELLESMGNLWGVIHYVNSAASGPLPGPYLVVKGRLFEIFRLYDDTHGAFMSATVLRPPL